MLSILLPASLEPLCTVQVTAIFVQYRTAVEGGGQAVPQQVARSMDGALLAVGALSDILKQKVSPPILHFCCKGERKG